MYQHMCMRTSMSMYINLQDVDGYGYVDVYVDGYEYADAQVKNRCNVDVDADVYGQWYFFN